MTTKLTIYELDQSVEDDRPTIDFEDKANQRNDWLRLDDILQGQRPVADYREVRVAIARPDATSWGFFGVPGTLGLISAEVVERIGQSIFRLYDLLPARLNEARFFFLKPNDVLPCLDREKSEIVTFRSDPSQVKEIRKYVFHRTLIPDAVVFSIPESISRIFATATVFDAIVQCRIPGFRFTALD